MLIPGRSANFPEALKDPYACNGPALAQTQLSSSWHATIDQDFNTYRERWVQRWGDVHWGALFLFFMLPVAIALAGFGGGSPHARKAYSILPCSKTCQGLAGGRVG